MLRLLEFRDKRYTNVVRLAARYIGQLYTPPEIHLILTSARRCVDPSATVRPEEVSQCYHWESKQRVSCCSSVNTNDYANAFLRGIIMIIISFLNACHNF